MRVSSVLLFVFLTIVTRASAQQRVPPVDSSAVMALRLTDGSELMGRVVVVDDTSLTLLTFAGARVILPRSSILSWRRQSGRLTAGGFQRSDPNTSRLFFGPTARTLPRGDGYFADYYLFFPVAGVGVSDRVMLSGGVSLVPGATSQLMYVGGKVGLVRYTNAAVAVGGFWGTVPGESNASLGMGYAVTTVGDEDHAITLMGGIPFTTQDLAPEPLFMVGGETRAGKGAKLMAELWVLPEVTEVPALFGVRWFGEKLAVNFGFIHVLGGGIDGWPLIPWMDFAVNW